MPSALFNSLPDKLSIGLTSCILRVAKKHQNSLRFLPGTMLSSHQGAMAGIRIAVQLIQILNQSGPQRVEVNVAYQFKKIGILLA